MTNIEQGRIDFVMNRDGKEGAINFCKQTLSVYRKAIKRNKNGVRTGYGSAYRKSLVLSCIAFRKFLQSNK